MNNYFLFFLALITLNVNAQKIDNTFFLLGTIEEINKDTSNSDICSFSAKQMNYIEKSKFKNKQEVYSYLAGIMCRRGTKDQLNYYISFPAGIRNFEEIVYLLKKYCGGFIEYRRCFSCIPNVIKIIFTLYCDDIKTEEDDIIDKELLEETRILSTYLSYGLSHRQP